MNIETLMEKKHQGFGKEGNHMNQRKKRYG